MCFPTKYLMFNNRCQSNAKYGVGIIIFLSIHIYMLYKYKYIFKNSFKWVIMTWIFNFIFKVFLEVHIIIMLIGFFCKNKCMYISIPYSDPLSEFICDVTFGSSVDKSLPLSN